jgi:hypothetical protein
MQALGLLNHIIRLASAWLHRVLRACEHEAHCRATEAMLCISQSHASSLALQDLLDDIITSVQYVTQAESVCLYMVDEAEGELWAARSTNPGVCTGD